MPGDNNMERYTQYRKDLAEDITTIHKQDPEKARDILDKEKEKREYVAAEAWQNTEGRPNRQEKIKSEKENAEQKNVEQREGQESREKIARLKELGIESLHSVGWDQEGKDFLRDVILKEKDFTGSIAGVGAMDDGDIIGEEFALKLEEFLKKLNFEDYGFLLKLTETFSDKDRVVYKTSFDITPLKKFFNLGDFKTVSASDLIIKEKLIKFSRSIKGYRGGSRSECKIFIEIPGGKTFIIDQEGSSEEEQKKVMIEIKKEYEKVMM